MAISNETREDFMQSIYDMFSDDENNDRANQIIDMFDIATENCVDLPCKVGDTVYYLDTKFEKQGRKKVAIEFVESAVVDNIQLGQIMIPQLTVCNKDNIWTMFDVKNDLGKTAFLTREEAEQALKGRGNSDT